MLTHEALTSLFNVVWEGDLHRNFWEMRCLDSAISHHTSYEVGQWIILSPGLKGQVLTETRASVAHGCNTMYTD